MFSAIEQAKLDDALETLVDRRSPGDLSTSKDGSQGKRIASPLTVHVHELVK